jgi:hypothetical protein
MRAPAPLTRRPRRVAALATSLAIALALGCAGGATTPAATPEPARDDWSVLRDSVATLVVAERHAAADSLLRDFAVRTAGTPQAAEATFWRAMVALDPENPVGSPRDALVAIDSYLAGGLSQPRYAEATVLRRTAEVLERASQPVPVAPPVVVAASDSLLRLRAAQDTIRQLRNELETTKTELDRIKRRIRP